jgi:threonylcarbamoyladenosine tRNA methylthiotransferase MtaB
VATFHIENFGCRATQADGAALERQFEARGLARASAAQADLVILNSCTVTNSADQDARSAIRRVQRQNPLAKIIVTGCYAQRAPQEVAALPGVTCVIGNSHKHQLAEIVLDEVAPKSEGFVSLAALSGISQRRTTNDERPLYVSDIFAHTELLAAPVFESANAASRSSDRTRPNLKVQDGCDNRCSFCVIPSVRGHSRSLPLPQIIREVNSLVEAGYREVVISGINLGRWGRDLDLGRRTSDLSYPASVEARSEVRSPRSEVGRRQPNFESLIRAILTETQLEKLRISSVEPMDWTDELIALVASSPRIARHAHVPLQSGSDAVLRRMHRKYRPWHYREKIEKIRAAMPTAAIGADVMAGFPGETDAEFESTRRLIADLPFTYLHVFTFSARPGTPAAAMPNQVPVHVARERNKILRDLAAEKKQAFLRSFLGKPLDAITLGSYGADSCGAGTLAREPLGTYSSGADSSGAGSPGAGSPGAGTPFAKLRAGSAREPLGTPTPNPDVRTPASSHACHSEPLAAARQRGESERGISEPDFTEALTDNYQKLYLKGRHTPNRWITVQVEEVEDGALVGSLAQPA